MKKSRTETVDTRKRILSTAARMFLANGLAETGIASIMTEAGLTQGGFYRHFRSKEQLIVEASVAANEKLVGYFNAAVKGKSASEALDTAVVLYLDQLTRQDCQGICPLPHLGSELRRADKQVREAAMAGYLNLVKFFAALAKAAGTPEPMKLADAMVATMVGAVLLAKLAGSPEAAREIVANARAAIKTMLSAAEIA